MKNRNILRRALALVLTLCLLLPAASAFAATNPVDRIGEAMAKAAGTTGSRKANATRYDFVTSAGHECYFSCSLTPDGQYLKGGGFRDMSFRTHPNVGAEITMYYFPMVKELLRQIVRPEEVEQAVAWLDAQEDAIYSAWQYKRDYDAPDPGLASMEFMYKYDKDYNELYMGVICKASTPMVMVNGLPYKPAQSAPANIREKLGQAMAAEVGVTGKASEFRYDFDTTPGDNCYLTATMTSDQWSVQAKDGVSMSFRTHPSSVTEITIYYFPLLRALLHEIAPAKDVAAIDAWLFAAQHDILDAFISKKDFDVVSPAVSSMTFKFKYDVDYNELYIGIGFVESTPVCTVNGVPYRATVSAATATPRPVVTPRPTATPRPQTGAPANIREKLGMAMAAEVGVTGKASEFQYTFNTTPGDNCYLTATMTTDKWEVKASSGVSMSFRTHPSSTAEITTYYFPMLQVLLHEIAPAKDVAAIDAWLFAAQHDILDAFISKKDFDVTSPAVSSMTFKFKYDVDYNELYIGIGFVESTPVCTVNGVPYRATASAATATPRPVVTPRPTATPRPQTGAPANIREKLGMAMAAEVGVTGKASEFQYTFNTTPGNNCYLTATMTTDKWEVKASSGVSMSFRTHPSSTAEITTYYFPMLQVLLHEIAPAKDVAAIDAWLTQAQPDILDAFISKKDFDVVSPAVSSMTFKFKYDVDYNELYIGIGFVESTPVCTVNGVPYRATASAATATPRPVVTPAPQTGAPANIREKLGMAMAAEVGVTGKASEFQYTFDTTPGNNCYLTATMTTDKWGVKASSGVSMSFRTHPSTTAEITTYYFPLLRALLHEIAPAKDVAAIDAWLTQAQPDILDAFIMKKDFDVTSPAVSSMTFKFKYDVDYNELYIGIGFVESTPVCTVNGVPYRATEPVTTTPDLTTLLFNVFGGD